MIPLKDQELELIFGILGNAVSLVVFLAPISTFYSIYKRKSSEGYQSIPYAVALFSAIMLLYYGLLKTDGTLIITINSFGCVIELIYLILYLTYAPHKAKVSTLKMLLLFNFGISSVLMLLTSLLVKGPKRVTVVGWICAFISVCVFASPLSVMRQVMKTRSVEFMPFLLSFFLTLSATVWFFYGFFVRDFFIAVPNIIGFLLGLAQMILYAIYRGSEKQIDEFDVNLSKLEPSEELKLKVEINTSHSNGHIVLKIIEDHV